MVVSEDRGMFLTQRSLPALCRIKTHLPPQALRLRSHTELGTLSGIDSPSQPLCLSLSHRGQAPLKIPLSTEGRQVKVVTAKVWEWEGPVMDEGDDAATWLSATLQRPVRCASDRAVAPRSQLCRGEGRIMYVRACMLRASHNR
jgi:uncharacterized protein YcbX